MKENIIGRQSEIERLERYVKSNRSELIAIYGRRRIGKTYLVKELFEGRFTFRMTGRENASTKEQLQSFRYALSAYTDVKATPRDWTEAFHLLATYIDHEASEGDKIVFIDDLPWCDTTGSRFVSALEHFWNDWATYRRDIKLIVCGSATTWMLDNVINSRGGLHNRTTHTILLAPFTLQETELFFKSFGFTYERQEIIECYMAVGGVAYYLSLFEREKSVAQNIESLCFTRGGELVDEFNKVFRSLFKKADNHIAVIKALQKKGMGMTRLEIIEEAEQVNNGNLTRLLAELESCAFIRSYAPFKKNKKEFFGKFVKKLIILWILRKE